MTKTVSNAISWKVGAVGGLAALTLVAAGCSGSSSNEVEIQDAWARTTAPGLTMGAVYMEAKSSEGDEITGASVPGAIAGTTELHETLDSKGCEEVGMGAGHSMDKGKEGSMDMEGDESMDMEMDSMKCMKQVSSIDLPAGETVNLEPGGFHVMLLDLKKPIEEGETFEVTLSFDKGDDAVAEVTARDEE
ncbi:MAG: copper chaperone PCu(A)C [Solirubrobacterales bacterium]